MKKQNDFIKKLFWVCLTFTLLFLLVLPTIGFANNSFFDCLEDEESCEEENITTDNTSIPGNSEEEIDDQGKSTVGVTAGDYIKMLFALVFVVGLLYALLKFVNGRNRLYDKNRLMKNVGGISLGQQKSVQLIVVGNTYYLIGVGEDIRLLKEITDPNEIASLLEYYEGAEEAPYKGLFEQILMKVSPFQKKQSGKKSDETEDFSKLFNHRLTEIKTERKKQFHRLTEKERSEDD